MVSPQKGWRMVQIPVLMGTGCRSEVSSVPAATLFCTPSAKNKHKYPAHGPKVPKFKAVFKKQQRSFTEVFALD